MINLVYTFADNYSMQAGVSLFSLFENNKDIRFHLFIIGDNISQNNIDKFTRLVNSYNNQIDIIEMPDFEKLVGFPLQTHRWVKSVYSKLFFCELLPENIDKVLFIDADTLIVNKIDYLAELLQEVWPDDCYAAGCISIAPILRRFYDFKENEYYIGTGFLLIDLKKWRHNGIQKLFIKELIRRKGMSVDADQSYFNCILINKIKVLPAEYNVVTNYYSGYDQYTKEFSKKEIENVVYTEEDINNAVNNPVIVHFLGDDKSTRPWYTNGKHPMKKEWLRYWKLTEWNDVTFTDYPVEVKKTKKTGLKYYILRHINLRKWILNVPFVAKLVLLLHYKHSSKLYR